MNAVGSKAWIRVRSAILRACATGHALSPSCPSLFQSLKKASPLRHRPFRLCSAARPADGGTSLPDLPNLLIRAIALIPINICALAGLVRRANCSNLANLISTSAACRTFLPSFSMRPVSANKALQPTASRYLANLFGLPIYS